MRREEHARGVAPKWPVNKGKAGAIALVGALVGCGGTSPTGVAQPDALTDVMGFLQAVHPSLHRHRSAEELDVRLAEAQLRLEGASPVERPHAQRRGLVRLLASVGDAHLALGFSNQQPGRDRLPLLVKRAGERVFVDASEPAQPRGIEVVAIDGVPIDDFMAELGDLANVDGDRPEVRAAEAERRFGTFAWLTLTPKPQYRVSLRDGDSTTEEVWDAVDLPTLQALETARYSLPVWGGERGPDHRFPEWRRHDGAVVLRLATFGVQDGEAYAARLAEAFASLVGDEPLVLDLRGNEGGFRTLGIEVLRYLVDRPFVQWRSVRTRVLAIPEAYRERVLFPFGPVSALEDFPGHPVEGGWRFEGDPLADRMVPHERVHRGPVTVFVDDATNSAAVELVVALLAHREGVRVVGQPTQGACDRHIGQLPVLLPVHDDAVVVSLFELEHVQAPGCTPDQGVLPHVRVHYREQDFRDDADPYLEHILR